MKQTSLSSFFRVPNSSNKKVEEEEEERKEEEEQHQAPKAEQELEEHQDTLSGSAAADEDHASGERKKRPREDDTAEDSIKEDGTKGDGTKEDGIKKDGPKESGPKENGSKKGKVDAAATPSMFFSKLSGSFAAIENSSERLKKTSILKDFFLDVLRSNPDDLISAVYLCVGRIAPAYEGIELGLGESILMQAIGEATGLALSAVRSKKNELGDLGKVAAVTRLTQRTMYTPPPLTLKKVFDSLQAIAKTSGNQAMKSKVKQIQGLLVACQENDAKYLIRLLEGKLRIGLAEQTVLVSLAQAAVYHEKDRQREDYVESMVQILKTAYSELPNYEIIIKTILEHGIAKLPKYCSLTPGIPVKPMLAHPTRSISEVLNEFESRSFTSEFKYDGERCQVHKSSSSTTLFSRNSENLTPKYPDVLERLHKVFKPSVETFVLDCESVAWDVKKKTLLPFQVLSTRKRKLVSTEEVTVQVCLFCFDLLYLNGKSLLKEPFEERRRLLHEHFQEIEDEFVFAKAMDATTTDDIQAFLELSVKSSCEGLMVKDLGSTYEPAKRSNKWLKVKKDYLEGVGDTLDLVIIGAYRGAGQRQGVYGAYLLACYNPDEQTYEAICKIGTGFSEEQLKELHALCSEIVVESKPSDYLAPTPEVWFEASKVIEVKCADLSLSPLYQAAVSFVGGTNGKGVSLRFPRFIRIRDDKNADEATTSEQVATLYRNQNHQKSSLESVDDDD